MKCDELCSQHAKIEALIENIGVLLDEQRKNFSMLLERLTRQEELLSQYLANSKNLNDSLRILSDKVNNLEAKIDKFEGALSFMKMMLYLGFTVGGTSIITVLYKLLGGRIP